MLGNKSHVLQVGISIAFDALGIRIGSKSAAALHLMLGELACAPRRHRIALDAWVIRMGSKYGISIAFDAWGARTGSKSGFVSLCLTVLLFLCLLSMAHTT